MKDDYKRSGRGLHAWGSKERKADSKQRKSRLRASVKLEPTEPEVHPEEINLIEFEASCRHAHIEDGYCLRCWRPIWGW